MKKKKLVWQIFPSFLMITVLSLSAVTYYSTRYFKSYFIKNAEKELTIKTRLLEENFARILTQDINQVHLVNALCREAGEKTDTRVTVTLPSGKVIGDSHGDIGIMENHASRPEIIKAMNDHKGVSIRYSATLDRNMMYIAFPVHTNSRVVGVVRTSVSISDIDQEVRSVRNNILFALLLTVLAAAAASLYVARRIAQPVEDMKKGAAQFAKGNLATRLSVPDSEELSELAVTMNQMARNLEKTIREHETRSMELEAVHSSMQEGVIAIDKDERIITVNTAAAKILDIPTSDVKSRSILEVVGNLELLDFIQRALATHEPVEDDIVLYKDEDVILNIHSTTLYESGKKRMGTLIIFHDITRIRRLERMHKQFAANVSHELKTPLTTIKGFIETIQGGLDKEDIKESHRFLMIIEKNVNRMVDLINDLLALSRLERLQGTRTSLDEQNILSLIQIAVNACKERMKEKNISITTDCRENLTAMVDAGLMEQALINLVDNAVKYSPAGSGITVSASQRDSFIDIKVSDEGQGIGKDHLPKIFNRFYRVDKARSRQEGGTGLGLAIVKHIVQYHRGKIDVKSVKGQGSTFKISIPA